MTGQLAASVGAGLLAIALFFTAADLIGNLAGELRDGIPFSVVLRLEALKVPSVLVQVAWVAMLAGLLTVLGQMARHREYIAMLASGVSVYQISLPVIFVASLLAVGVFGVQEALVPPAHDAAANLRGIYAREGEADLRGTILDITYSGVGNRTYVLQALDVDAGTLRGVQMHRIEGHRIMESLYAVSGTWSRRQRRWVWHDTVRRTFDAEQRITAEERMPAWTGYLRASPRELRIEKRLALNKYDLAYLSIAQLGRRIRTVAETGHAPAGLRVAYYAKWSEPFATIVIALISISWAVSVERRGMVRGVAICVAACMGFFALREIGLALGKGGALPPPLAAWGPLMIGTGFGIYWLRRTPT